MTSTATAPINNSTLVAAEMEAMRKRIAELEAEKAARSNHSLSCKVSEKGAVSVYGLGRFPVSLYGAQWDRLLAFGDNIKKFMDEHRSELSTK